MVNLGLYSPVESGRTAPTSGCNSRGRTSGRSWSLLPQMCQSRDVWRVQRYNRQQHVINNIAIYLANTWQGSVFLEDSILAPCSVLSSCGNSAITEEVCGFHHRMRMSCNTSGLSAQ